MQIAFIMKSPALAIFSITHVLFLSLLSGTGGSGLSVDSELVRHLRATLGVTQKELAIRLGLNQSTVSRWERGMTRPDMDTRRRLHALVEGAASHAEGSLRLVVAHSPAAMALFDAEWRVLAVSPSFARLAAMTAGEAAGTDFRRRFTPELAEAARIATARGLFTGGTAGVRIVCPLPGSNGGAATWTDGTWHVLRLDGQDRVLILWQCRPVEPAEAATLTGGRAGILDLADDGVSH